LHHAFGNSGDSKMATSSTVIEIIIEPVMEPFR
jgi:hypothetical protein